ncbi:MAG: hypothetical protein ACLTLQ_15645 [[Clostridium] scindens]
MDYTTVFCSTASECAPLRNISSRYSGALALGRIFYVPGERMSSFVYDDLSKHAVAYRAISLLLGRSPGGRLIRGTYSICTQDFWN